MKLHQLVVLVREHMQCIQLHLVPQHIIHPPTQLQNFGNTNTSLPKDPKSIGGQTNLERAEIERGVKALRDRVQVLRQERIDRELAQRKEALPIDITGKKNDDSETKSASVEKAESSSIYSESIKSKEASILRKGMASIAKQPRLIFLKLMEPTSCPMSFVP